MISFGFANVCMFFHGLSTSADHIFVTDSNGTQPVSLNSLHDDEIGTIHHSITYYYVWEYKFNVHVVHFLQILNYKTCSGLRPLSSMIMLYTTFSLYTKLLRCSIIYHIQSKILPHLVKIIPPGHIYIILLQSSQYYVYIALSSIFSPKLYCHHQILFVAILLWWFYCQVSHHNNNCNTTLYWTSNVV